MRGSDGFKVISPAKVQSARLTAPSFSPSLPRPSLPLSIDTSLLLNVISVSAHPIFSSVGKDNAWIEFYTNWRAEHASEIEGKRASEVAKECARAYAPLKEENAKKREAEKTEKKA